MKKITALLALLSLAVLASAEEQYTRIAVVDIGKVYNQFRSDSREARELEDLKTAFKQDFDRMVDELKQLKTQKADALSRGDNRAATELDSQITKKETNINEFRKIRVDQINAKRDAMMQGDNFIKRLLEEVDFVAKAQGFSIVLNSKTDGLLYYNQEVDITQQVIDRLSGK